MPSERLARLEAQSEQTHRIVSDLHAHIVGKPGTDGIVTRVSKVEHRQSLIMRVAGTVVAAFFGVFMWLLKGKV